MNGYGQQVSPYALALHEAMADWNKVQQRQAHQAAMARSGNPYALLGSAIGGLLANKFGTNARDAEAALLEAEFNRNNELEQIKQQQMAQAEAQKQAQVAAEKKAKFQALIPQFGEQMAYAHVYGGADIKDMKPEQTAQMQNLASMGLKPGTLEYNQAMNGILTKSNAPTVNVNSGEAKFGKIPEGFMMKETPQGVQMVPVPGSPAEKQANIAQTKAKIRGITSFDNGQNIDTVIDTALNNADGWTTGFLGSLGSMVPGTGAHDLQQNLKTIEADAAFDTLQAMREASPTGGALGNVSEGELGLLKAAKAALSQSQSPAQFRENLKRYQQVRRNAMKNVAKAYEMTYNEPAPFMPKEDEEKEQNQATKSLGGVEYVQINGQWYQK